MISLLVLKRWFLVSENVRLISLKEHSGEEMVLMGKVREVARIGNESADEAPDLFGRRRGDPAVIDARRNLSGVCRLWYPVVLV